MEGIFQVGNQIYDLGLPPSSRGIKWVILAGKSRKNLVKEAPHTGDNFIRTVELRCLNTANLVVTLLGGLMQVCGYGETFSKKPIYASIDVSNHHGHWGELVCSIAR